MPTSDTLVLFSAYYPYELPLRKEVPVLAENFEKVFFIPSRLRTFDDVELPANVEVCDVFTKQSKFSTLKVLVTYFWSILSVYVWTLFFDQGRLSYIFNFKTYFKILIEAQYKAAQLDKFVTENNLHDAIFYDYWFVDSVLSLCLLKRRGVIKKVYSRIHGFDLFDERWKSGTVPYRSFKIKHLNKILCISDFGRNYLMKKVSPTFSNKLLVSRLGVDLPLEVPTPKEGKQTFLIVSCSNIYDFKRVHLIPEILKPSNLSIKWIHFGDGPLRDDALTKAGELPDNVQYEFRGRVTNAEVLEFFSQNEVDFFISLSVSEGLPISMMEAISYGIPVFACNISGIPELVNSTTGALFELEDTPEVIAKKFLACLETYNFDRELIKKFFKENFYFKSNYQKFVGVIKAEEYA